MRDRVIQSRGLDLMWRRGSFFVPIPVYAETSSLRISSAVPTATLSFSLFPFLAPSVSLSFPPLFLSHRVPPPLHLLSDFSSPSTDIAKSAIARLRRTRLADVSKTPLQIAALRSSLGSDKVPVGIALSQTSPRDYNANPNITDVV